MATMTMTLIGIYNTDPEFFDDITLPEGINKDTFVNNLLFKSGEFELLYPDPVFMKSLFPTWSDKWNRTFSEWLRGTQSVWNPIENYDRYEESADGGTSSGTDSTTASSSGHDEGKVSAYDSSSYQPSTYDENSSSTGSSSNTSGKFDNTHTSHIHGNIGVTQASTMLQEFYRISEWNLYDHMADVFISEFLIPVY